MIDYTTIILKISLQFVKLDLKHPILAVPYDIQFPAPSQHFGGITYLPFA
jgi:hypothetical protein